MHIVYYHATASLWMLLDWGNRTQYFENFGNFLKGYFTGILAFWCVVGFFLFFTRFHICVLYVFELQLIYEPTSRRTVLSYSKGAVQSVWTKFLSGTMLKKWRVSSYVYYIAVWRWSPHKKRKIISRTGRAVEEQDTTKLTEKQNPLLWFLSKNTLQSAKEVLNHSLGCLLTTTQ